MTYIADIDPTSPLGTDQINQGDNQIRGFKLDVFTSFPNVDGEVSSTPAQMNQSFNPETAAETTVSVTIVNWNLPEGHVERYQANTVPGTTNMTVGIQAAHDVLNEYDGGILVMPKGLILSDPMVFTCHGLTVTGQSQGAQQSQPNGTYWTFSSGVLDCVTFEGQSCTLRDIWIEGDTTEATLFLNNSPFFTLWNAAIINRSTDADCIGVYAWQSHHFAAYNSHILKDPYSGPTEGDGRGVIHQSDGTISGVFDYFNCRVKGWNVGIQVGQPSLEQWDDDTRQFDGPEVYPATEEFAGFNFIGGQFKSCTISIKLGSGINASQITGNYFENVTNTSQIRLVYGPRNVNITGNMFNMGGGDGNAIEAGIGGGDDERKEFWNIRVTGNWFRKCGGTGIKVAGTSDASLSRIIIHDNDVELVETDAVALDVGGADSVVDVARLSAYGTGVTPVAFITGFNNTNRPIAMVDCYTAPDEFTHAWSTLGDVTVTGSTVLDEWDPDTMALTADDNREISLGVVALNRGRRRTITNTSSFYIASEVANLDSGDTMTVFCDGAVWFRVD